jgi:hypothetical protein
LPLLSLVFSQPHIAAVKNWLHESFAARLIEDGGEVTMFEMLNDEKPNSDARKMFWVKVCMFVVAIAAMGGVIYFFAFLPYSHQ